MSDTPHPPPNPATIVTGRGRPQRGGGGAAGLRGLALLCALLAVAGPVLAVVAFRRGWVDFHLAHDIGLHRIVPGLAMAAMVLGVVALLAGLFSRPRRGAAACLVAIAVGAVVFAVVVGMEARARSATAGAPPVHEVSTDWRDPPAFSAKLLALRGPAANPIESAPAVPEGPGTAGFLGRQVAEVNARTCPAAAPAVLLTAPPQAYARAKAAVLKEGMTLVTDDPADGSLEATARQGLWAIADDLVVRVRPEGAGARVDLRSAARQGLNDGGADCARVTRIRAALGQ